MGYIADEIASEASSGPINGATSYRAFLGGFCCSASRERNHRSLS